MHNCTLFGNILSFVGEGGILHAAGYYNRLLQDSTSRVMGHGWISCIHKFSRMLDTQPSQNKLGRRFRVVIAGWLWVVIAGWLNNGPDGGTGKDSPVWRKADHSQCIQNNKQYNMSSRSKMWVRTAPAIPFYAPASFLSMASSFFPVALHSA